jgi:hypothetical protein
VTKGPVKWLEVPEEQDFPAALSYLSLIYDRKLAKEIVRRLKRARPIEFKAKDIFRASRLSLLGVSNSHVERDQRKIASGTPLSPLLLVRGPAPGELTIADGYHRLCAVYALDEDALVPCRIV